MLPIHTILHPTDFSEHSGYALTLACALTRDYRARFVMLHVAMPPTIAYGEGVVPAEPEVFRREAEEQLNGVHCPDVNDRLERCLAEGEPAAEILRVAKDIGASLIVMGTHGRTGLSRLLMGSVAERVVRTAPCPVLTVKTPFPAMAAECAAVGEAVPESAVP